MEAEYTALSMALRAAIPFMEVCRYVISRFWTVPNSLVKFKTTVHEDNQGALALAKLEPGRTKIQILRHKMALVPIMA